MKRIVVLTTLVVISLLLYGCTAVMKTMVSEGLKLSMDYRIKEAIPVLEKELREDPNSLMAQGKRVNLAAMYNLDNRPQKALSLMKEATTKYKG